MNDQDFIAFGFSKPLPIVAAVRTRQWMIDAPDGFPQRCLPMLMANQCGWWILNDTSFRVRWAGTVDPSGLEIVPDDPYGKPIAASIFGQGILTFHIPYFFRTPMGTQLWVRGPANDPKDGTAALEGIVETDWAVAPFTMNWKITRPNHWIKFEKGEPICHVMPLQIADLEALSPRVEPIEHAPDTQRRGLEQFLSGRETFVHDMRESPDSEAAQQGWQKHYFQGRSPAVCSGQGQHRTKIALEEFQIVSGESKSHPTFLDPTGH